MVAQYHRGGPATDPRSERPYLRQELAKLENSFTQLFGNWSIYTPTLGSSAGGPLTPGLVEGASLRMGATVFIYIRGQISANNGASGYNTLTLPYPARVNTIQVLAARDTGGAGTPSIGVELRDSEARIYSRTGGYPGHDGADFVMSGVYWAQQAQ